MIENKQLNNGGINSNLRETDKGYFYANRVDTTSQRRNLSIFTTAANKLSQSADKQQKVYNDNESARAEVASAKLSDPQLHEAMANDNNSAPYRTALRSVALHRSYINIAAQVQQHSQDLLGQNLPATEFQKQLTSYTTGLMNNNPDVKNFDPQVVATQFYNPLLKEIGNQTIAYSAHVGQQMKEQALQGIGEAAEAESTRMLDNSALSNQQRIEGVTNALQQAEQQLKSGGYDSRVRGGKIMQTAIALTEKTGNLSILRSLKNVKFNGKPISEYPEYLTMINSTTNVINERANTLQRQRKADHLRAEQDSVDSMYILGMQGGSVSNDATGANATRAVIFNSKYTSKQKKAYLSGMNVGLTLNNNATTTQNKDYVNKVILDHAKGIVDYTAAEWAARSEQLGLSHELYVQGMNGLGIGKQVRLSEGYSNNPLLINLKSNIQSLYVKPKAGVDFNGNNNIAAQQAASTFIQAANEKITANKGAPLTAQDNAELEKLAEKLTNNFYKQKAQVQKEGTSEVTTDAAETKTTHQLNSESVQQGITVIGGLNNGNGMSTLHDIFKSNPDLDPSTLAEQLIKRYPSKAGKKQQLIDAITYERNNYEQSGY